MTVTDCYFHVIPEDSYVEPQIYKYEDSYVEPLPLRYDMSQQNYVPVVIQRCNGIYNLCSGNHNKKKDVGGFTMLNSVAKIFKRLLGTNYMSDFVQILCSVLTMLMASLHV